MTDLTGMVEWLRSQIETTKVDAPQMHRDGCTWVVQRHYYPCDCGLPNDTIARCEQELKIISCARFLGDRAERAGDRASSTVITDGRYRVLEDVVRRLAYGYRNREGWKEGWKP